MTADLLSLGSDFRIPFIVVEGREDDYTPAALSQAYVESITAPQKALVTIKGAGHLALITHSAHFSNAMLKLVRPVLQKRANSTDNPLSGQSPHASPLWSSRLFHQATRSQAVKPSPSG